MWNISVVGFVLLTNVYSISSLPSSTQKNGLEEVTIDESSSYLLDILAHIFEYSNEDVSRNIITEETNETPKIRVKRQGKFTEAAKGSHGKTFRLIVQMFTNLIGSSAIGGSRPLPPLPKPVIRSFKQHFLEAFYPESEVKRDE